MVYVFTLSGQQTGFDVGHLSTINISSFSIAQSSSLVEFFFVDNAPFRSCTFRNLFEKSRSASPWWETKGGAMR